MTPSQNLNKRFFKEAIPKKQFYKITSRGKLNSCPTRNHYRQIFKVIKVFYKKLTAVAVCTIVLRHVVHG
jgi:hypothetical protein